jgi:hypothetical protein
MVPHDSEKLRKYGPSTARMSVAYGVVYASQIGHIPAVLSVEVVRLGNRSVFQDRLNRPL